MAYALLDKMKVIDLG